MPDKLDNAKAYALRGLGGVLTTAGAIAASKIGDIGGWMQTHPSETTALVGSGALVLYAWALWTYSLWKRDSKRSKIREAKELGRPICGCTEAGEIMLATDWGTSFWRDHECPLCKSKQQVKIRD